MLAAIVGLQQNILPTRNFARILLMLFLIFCLVIRNVYQGALFKFLQSDGRHKQIDKIDDMLDENHTFYTFETDLSFIYNSSRNFKLQFVSFFLLKIPLLS